MDENEDQIKTMGIDLFTVYPNPANDNITIDYRIYGSETDAHLIISDNAGKIIIKQNLSNVQNQEIIDVSSWTSGQYLCTLFIGKKIKRTQKIVISN